MSTSTSTRTSNRNRLTVIAVASVVALLAVVIGGEFYARHRVTSCMSAQFRKELGSKVDIGLGWKPVLIEMIDGKVPTITIDSADIKFGPALGMKVHAEAKGIQLEDSGQRAGTIDHSTAHVVWTVDGIGDTLRDQAFGTLVSGVKTNPADGTLIFEGLSGLGRLTVTPVVQHGTVQVHTKNAQVLGFGLPTDLVDGIVKIVAGSLQNYPIGMSAQSVTITDAGLEMSLAGGRFDLPREQAGVVCT